MAEMMLFPILFNDEVWDQYNGSFEPQHAFENDRIIFLNPIIKPGTEHNQGNMNNLLDFDNADSFPGCDQILTFPEGKAVSEWRRANNQTLVARREMDFSTMTQTTIFYFQDGKEAQRRIVKITFPTGQIKQEVTI